MKDERDSLVVIQNVALDVLFVLYIVKLGSTATAADVKISIMKSLLENEVILF